MLLTTRQQDQLRQVYKRQIHNETHAVKIAIKLIVNVKNPEYDDSNSLVPQYYQFDDFTCSSYVVLSGKTSRIFQNRLDLIPMDLGILEKAEYQIQYVMGQYDLLAATGVATNLTPSGTTLQVDSENFEDRVKIGAQIRNTTDGSLSYVTTVVGDTLTFATLTGGTLNLFTATDTFEVYNLAELNVGDEMQLRNQWWSVLAVIPDSINVQVTALLGR